ncbi:hypothetical protein [Microvirga sp. VF16]|uniref:hypothetical protein n=1 Tax=Microvirga sp. VF16 TaxID=2807101 RepID=UPI00193E2C89|nr:hypothetical protein [Microvirga sp. VF16]QRM31428.1 hypothetical protein JO965_10810 [Microvirga sp. VF16]
MTGKRNFLCTGLCTATLLLAATGAMAAPVDRVGNDNTINGSTFNKGESATGPQMNRCWGEMASQLAKLPTDSAVGANGSGMGIHSKSANTPQDTFRDSTFGGTGPRLGIGNASSLDGGPHGVSPADGGNGQHAINNGSTTTEGVSFIGNVGFSQFADPLTGEITTTFGGTADPVTTLHCSLEQPVP